MRATLAVAGTVLALAGLEVALRVHAAIADAIALERSQFIEHYWALPDEELGFRLDPDYGDHNELGLRDDPVGPVGDRSRILVLGDSVGYYGKSIADTWVGHLEARLAGDAAPTGVDVVNACVKGYTTHQELAWLERDGLALKPDLVVLGFVLNDLHRFLHTFHVRDGRILDTEPYAVTDDSAVRSRSRLVQWVRWRLQRGVLAAGRTGDGFEFERRIGARTAWQDEPWIELRRQLDTLTRLGREHGFDTAVVVFPMELQYRPDYLARDAEYVQKPQRELRSVCSDLGIPLLDLYSDLEPESHMLPDGLHLSAEGRRLVGELVAGFLIEEGLVLRD